MVASMPETLNAIDYGTLGFTLVCFLGAIRVLWTKVDSNDRRMTDALAKSEEDVKECRDKHSATKEELTTLAIKVASLEGSEVAYNRVESRLTALHNDMLKGIHSANSGNS